MLKFRIAMAIEDDHGSYWDLDKGEQGFHRRFHTGQLQKAMITASRDYGHGLGVPEPISLEEMAHLVYSTNVWNLLKS